MSTETINVNQETLIAIFNELDRPRGGGPLHTAAKHGLILAGGLDHAEVKANGWVLKLYDRGLNGRSKDFVFTVPVSERTSRRGPLA